MIKYTLFFFFVRSLTFIIHCIIPSDLAVHNSTKNNPHSLPIFSASPTNNLKSPMHKIKSEYII